jgi:hypothetical protein
MKKKLLAILCLLAAVSGCAVYEGITPPASADGLYIFVPRARAVDTRPAIDPNEYQ